jgi:metal transporter CNNM
VICPCANSLHPIELIGEEIYDEFDLRGAQALPASTYVPPEAQRAVALADTKRRLKKQLLSAGTSSVPTTPVPLDSPTLNPPPTQTTSITSKLSMGLQLPHKVAKALKFERSRSVPGRIRDESPSERSSIIPTSTPPEPSTTPETSALRPDGLPALSANTMPGMTMPVKSSSAPPAAVVAMEAESKEDLDLHHFNNSSITIKEDDDSPLVPITLSTPKGSPHPVHDILPPIEGAATPTTPAQAKVSLPLSRGPSRSGSPVPSLLNEAILIERGRRAVETGSNGASKGRFKSSPLVGVRLTPPPNLLNTTEASSEPSSKTNEDE